MGKIESKHIKEKSDSKMMTLEAEEQGKLETVDKKGMFMLSNDNY